MSAARSQLIAATIVGLSVSIGLADPASSAPITAFIFNNTVYEQTSSSAPTTPDHYFFSIGATQTAGDFNVASAAYPGPGSPVSLPLINPTTFNFNSPSIASLGVLRAAYPFGTYSIITANTVTSASTTGIINYTADYFASTVPYLTNYSALNGLNPTAAFTFSFPAFTPNPNVTQGFTFLTVYDATSGLVVTADEFQPPSTTSFTIPSNTLAQNHKYNFELDFSDRLNGPLVGNAFTEQGFDLRTDGSFTTAPAPSIGFGLPVFLAAGGVWFGARLLQRNPTSRNPAVLTGAKSASRGLLAVALIAMGLVKPRRRGADLVNVA
jgi:hypothetical protein